MDSESHKPGGTKSGPGKVIKFYVPERHKRPTRRIPENQRGHVIEFPSPLKKPA